MRRLLRRVSRRWAGLAASCVLCALAGALRLHAAGSTGGRLIYVLDDPYITLAMARSFAEAGVWGVTTAAFTHTSSSPGWTLLLAALHRMGARSEAIPFVLSLVAGAIFLVIADDILRAGRIGARRRVMTLVLALFAAPLAAVAFTGLEHAAHAAAMAAWLYAAAVTLEAPAGKSHERRVLILAPLVTALRYESMLAVVLVSVVLARRGRHGLAMALLALAAAPLVAVGLAGYAHGWDLLPTSVALKGNNLLTVGTWAFLVRFALQVRAVLPLGALTCMVVWTLFAVQASPRARTFALLCVGTTLLHLAFAGVGWFFRYEAYLVAIGILALTITARTVPRGLAWRVCAMLTLALLVWRGVKSSAAVAPASAGVYRQQYQMGLFLRHSYQGRPVVVNDIGAVSYLARITPVDLAGLATMPVARARLSRTFGVETIRTAAREGQAQIALVYDSWYTATGGLPTEWVRVRRWTTRCPICSDDTVSFYGLTPAAARQLREQLDAFEPSLPDGISISRDQ